MNRKSTYNQNFDKAILKTMNCSIEDVESFKFKLRPIDEEIGQESSKDSWIKNTKLKNNRIEELKSYKDAIWLLSAGDSKYPLWINMTKQNEKEIKLEFSQRFRHIKTSQNQETGHPPFKVIYKIDNLVEKTNDKKEKLIKLGKLIEIRESNLAQIEIPTEYILYFLVDWSGPERLARYKIFNSYEKLNLDQKLYFIDGSIQNIESAKTLSQKFGGNFEMNYVGGHGTICFMRNNEVVDEIKFPHTLEEHKIEKTLSKWMKTIANT